MRRESSTVVVLVGRAEEDLLDTLARSPNLSVARVPNARAQREAQEVAAAPGWEAGALAMREAARRHSPYVIVAADPLAAVASAWRAMWDVAAGPGAAAGFEQRAAEALAAWRDKLFELPDYYLVVVAPEPDGGGPDLYLGPLRAARPQRIAVAPVVPGAAQAGGVLDTLRSLRHGPWWPPLDELIDTARNFYAGDLAETQPTGAPAGRPGPVRPHPPGPAGAGRLVMMAGMECALMRIPVNDVSVQADLG